MITVPAHVKNSKIEQDIRRKPGNRVVILRDEQYPHLIKIGRALFSKTFIACLVITTLVLYTSRAPFLKAEATSFYPKACLGGFDAIRNAEGKPDTKVAAGRDAFDSENSAYLSGEQSAEMYCGNFDGTVADHTVPNKITLTIYLTTKEKQDAPIIKNDTSASSTTFLQVLDATTTPILENGAAKDASTPTNGGAGDVTTPPQQEVSPEVPSQVPVAPKDPPASAIVPTPDIPSTDASPQTKLSIPSKLASYFITHVFAENDAASGEQHVSVLDVAAATEAKSDSSQMTEIKPGTTKKSEEKPSVPMSTSAQEEIKPASESSSSTEETAQLDTSSLAKPLDTPLAIENVSVAQSIKDALESFEVSDNVATSTEHPVFEVAYALGGDTWTPLALLGKENSRTISIQLPLETIKSWSDISKLQVRVKNAESLDARDDLYVDGMSLAIGYEKDADTVHIRDYVIKGIENTGTEMTVSLGGEKGKESTIQVKAKQKAGLAFYNLDTEALALTTEVNSDNPSDFDPNAMLPDFGSYALVLTTDTSWCSGKKLEECLTQESFQSLTYLDLFPSSETTESDSVTKLKVTLKGLLTYLSLPYTASSTGMVSSAGAPISNEKDARSMLPPEPVRSAPEKGVQGFEKPSTPLSVDTVSRSKGAETKVKGETAPAVEAKKAGVGESNQDTAPLLSPLSEAVSPTLE